MNALPGTLFALLGASCFYLASPRQQILAEVRRPGVLVTSGILCTGAGALFWHGEVDWPAALCATVAALAAGLALMPFAGSALGAAARRRAKLVSASGENTRAGRRTGIQ